MDQLIADPCESPAKTKTNVQLSPAQIANLRDHDLNQGLACFFYKGPIVTILGLMIQEASLRILWRYLHNKRKKQIFTSIFMDEIQNIVIRIIFFII